MTWAAAIRVRFFMGSEAAANCYFAFSVAVIDDENLVGNDSLDNVVVATWDVFVGAPVDPTI